MYASANDPSTTGLSYLWKSEDGGAQFDALRCMNTTQQPICSPPIGGYTSVATGTPQPPVNPPTPTHPPSAYFNTLDSTRKLTCAYSYDGGNNFVVTGPAPSQPAGAGQACNIDSNNGSVALGAGRQWTAVQRGHGAVLVDTIYVLVSTATQGPQLLRSPDGGQTYSLRSSATTCPAGCGAFSAASSSAVGIDGVATGNLAVDQNNGTLYEFLAHQNTVTQKWGVEVVGAPDPSSTAGTINWQALEIPGSVGTLSTANNYASGAVDSAGTVHVVWSASQADANSPQVLYYSHSTDQGVVRGSSWSTPVVLTGPGSGLPAVTAAALPVVVAGDAGRIDVAFDGAEKAAPFNPTADSDSWYVYFLQSLNANQSSPVFSAAVPTKGSDSLRLGRASQAAVHIGPICNFQGACANSGNHGAGDHLSVSVTADGAADIYFTDDSGGLGSAAGPAPIPYHVRQGTGRSLFASADSGQGYVTNPGVSFLQSMDLRPVITDPKGDATFPAHGSPTRYQRTNQDIIAVKMTPIDDSTLDVTITTLDPPVGPPNAAQCGLIIGVLGGDCAGEVNYFVVWRFNNQLYYAGINMTLVIACDPVLVGPILPTPLPSPYPWGKWVCAYTDPAVAGKPVTLPGTPVPNGLIYQANKATNTDISFRMAGRPLPDSAGPAGRPNDIDFLVPASLVGNPKRGDILRSVQGFTSVHVGSAPAPQDPAFPFAEQLDATAPMDYSVGNQTLDLASFYPPPQPPGGGPTTLPNTADVAYFWFVGVAILGLPAVAIFARARRRRRGTNRA